MRTVWTIGLLCVVLLVLAACAPGPNDMQGTPDQDGKIAGFWQGLWQGFILPITFVISLFVRSVHFYEVHNNGVWYNLGFVLGAGILTGGGFLGSRRHHD